MINDSTLYAIPTAWHLAEYSLVFGRDGAAAHLVVMFAGDTGSMKLRFRNPHPLSDTFAMTDNATGIRVLDATIAQRECYKIRVEFLTGEGQRCEFWAESVEHDT
jgi:hypothetical protein